MEADLLIKARWIVPVDPEGRVLEAHALAVRDGAIVDILPSAEADLRWRAREVLSLDRHVLIPGLINAHTHAAMALFRGLADDLPLIDWLTRHIWPAEHRWVADEFVRAGTRLAVAEMLRGGTTCFNDMYFFPNRVAELAAEAGMRAVAGLILIDFPTPWATDADEYLSKGLSVHDAFRAHPLIHFAFAPHAPYTVSDAPLERIGTLAEELDLPIHMHVHETAHEVDKAI
ncbi:MAG: amidohydrolase family protein, partial [Gammaproteobacteria bacterium]